MSGGTVKAERLLEVYEQISETPDAIARLRRFVLDLAVRGKLVEQDAGDEPASELLKQIEVEKAQIVRDGKFKQYEGTFERNQEAFSFQLPTSWRWCYLDDVAAVARGGSPRPIKAYLTDDPNGIPWIKIGDSNRGSVYIDSTVERIKPDGLAKSRLVVPGDLLLSNSMSFGFPYITNVEGCIHDGWLVIRTPEKLISKLFLHALFLSAHAKRSFAEAASGAVVQNLNADKVRQLSVPLPPLAEQHRIVAKVDELMALCDRLEEARKTPEEVRDKLTAASLARLTAPETTAEDFPTHAAFALEALPALTTRPDQIKTLRQTILNLAVRGKLVEQDAADEPASASLAEIAEARDADASRKSKRARGLPPVSASEEADMPTGWESVRLSDIAVSMRYGTSTKCGADASLVPVLRIPNVSSGQITLDDMKFGPLSEKEHADLALAAGDLLMIRSNGSLDIVGRSAVVPSEANGMAFAGYLVRLRTAIEHVNTNYVWMAMNSQLIRDQIEKPIRSAVGLKNVNLTEFGNLSFWLPPLAEQHRIVTKVDALMALCDRLEAALTTADTSRTRLLEALLHEALEPAAQAVTEVAE